MSSGREAVIVSAVRTATGRFLGTLLPFSATDLGAVVIREAVKRANVDPSTLDEVIMGNVVMAGLGQAPARQAAIKGGIPDTVSAVTINKICGSGLQSVMYAAQAIRAGDGRAYVAGGMESMSNGPYLLPKVRTGLRMNNSEVVDAVVNDGLWCTFEKNHMGLSAEVIADLYELKREELDEYSLNSHRKAVSAIKDGKFKAEIVPIEIAQKKGPAVVFDTDEIPRADTSAEALAKLPPAFKPGGKVTAGNASPLSDGASAVVVVDSEYAKENGLRPLARITGYASAAIQPRLIFACPPYAIRKVLAKTGLSISDFDLIEVNEAFASQIMANGKELGWDWDKVNVHGGGLALGHPIGSSGSRILTTLIYALRDRGLKRGLAALCLGGGGAVAMSVEAV